MNKQAGYHVDEHFVIIRLCNWDSHQLEAFHACPAYRSRIEFRKIFSAPWATLAPALMPRAPGVVKDAVIKVVSSLGHSSKTTLINKKTFSSTQLDKVAKMYKA